MRVLYLDVLFLVNLCMDYMALYISGALRCRRRSAKRLFLASFFGALYAACAVIFTGDEAIQNLIGIGVSVVMVWIAYEFLEKGEFLRTFITFYAVSLLLSAIVTVAYRMMNQYIVQDMHTSLDKSGQKTLIFLSVAAVGGLLIRLCGIWLTHGTTGKECRVAVQIADKTVEFCALIDSGNLLTDPLSGRKVVVVGLETMRAALPKVIVTMLETDPPDPSDLPYFWARRIRLIPTHSIGGDRLFVGILPDKMTVTRADALDKKAGAVSIDAILAIDTESSAKYGGYDAVMPMGLVA